MRNFYPEKNGVFPVMQTSDIWEAIFEAIEIACENHRFVTFMFSDVEITVACNSEPDLIYRDWMRAKCKCIDPKVSPHPKPVLTAAEKENDARIKANKPEALATIVVRPRSDDYQAYVEGEPGLWGSGKTEASAIGNLVYSHPGRFCITIERRQQ
jgi:hypothetical protein